MAEGYGTRQSTASKANTGANPSNNITMLGESSSTTSLPRRTWIAKFDPQTLEAYFGDPEHSSQLRSANTVWSDDFDNIIEPPASNNEQSSWSRRQICRMRTNRSPPSHKEHSLVTASSLLHGDRPSDRLFADDCFVDGLVEGVGLMVLGVVLLGVIASLAWCLSVRLGLCRSRRHRRCRHSSTALFTIEEEPDIKSDPVMYAEKV